MGCCDNHNPSMERESPEDIEPCCKVRGRTCLCLPYDDPWIISAQVLTVFSCCFAWISWGLFCINLAAMASFQILWCTRMRSCLLYTYVAAALAAFAGCTFVAIYVLVNWRKKPQCDPWYWYVMDDDWRDEWVDDDEYRYPNNGHENCKQVAWGSVTLVCAFLWAAAAFCVLVFVQSGRHAKWEALHTQAAAAENKSVELSTAVERADNKNQEASPLMAADAAVLETEKEDSVEEEAV